MRAALAIAAAAGAAALALPSGAGAATYDVAACGSGGQNNVWIPINTSPATLTVTQTCPPSGSESGLFIGDAAFTGMDTPGGGVAEWVFSAPPGTTVAGVLSSDWKLAIGNTGWVSYLRDGAGTLLDPCLGIDCKLGLPSPGGLLPVAFQRVGLNTTSLAFGVACASATHCANGGGPGQHDAAVSVHGVLVTLDDPTLPDLAPATGGLADSQNWLRGTQSIGVGASEAVSGVSRLHVEVDGQDIPGSPVVVGCDYTKAVPCPTSAQATLALDSASLVDGGHTISVGADNAGPSRDGARTVSWQIKVDNGVPLPLRLRTDSPPQAGIPFNVFWDEPTGPQGGPVVRADWQLRPADGGPGAGSGTVESQTDVARIEGLIVPRQGSWTLGVTLTDAAGNRGGEATVSFQAAPAGPRLAGRHVLIPLVSGRRARRFETVLVARQRIVLHRLLRVPAEGQRLSVLVPPLPRRSSTLQVRWRRVGARHFNACVLALPGHRPTPPCRPAFPTE